ncbi:MAG: hypothetical protein WDW38_006300 [Sanguina aurantia]
MLFCFTDLLFQFWGDQGFALESVLQGGDIFNQTRQQELLTPFSTFLGSAANADSIDAVEYGSISDVLGSDRYYGGSYKSQRYDDLQYDANGVDIQGMVNFTYVGQGGGASGSNPSGNCMLLTGAWLASTRYQLTFSLQNPAAPASFTYLPPPPLPPFPPLPPLSPSGAPPPPPAASPPGPYYKTPTLWIAPITFSVVSEPKHTPRQSLRFTLRGDKRGTACTPRPAIQRSTSRMFDSCAAAQFYGLPMGSYTNSTDCSHTLANNAATLGLAHSFPFTAPPVTSEDLSYNATANTSCPANSSWTSRLGGECIACGPGAVAAQGNSCTCPPTVVVNLVGANACGASISPIGNATDAADLAVELCAQYSGMLLRWQEHLLSDKVVARLFIPAFLRQASLFMDESLLADVNATFAATLVFDARRPASPTRATGLKPNCNRCTDGMFLDAFSGDMVPVYDNHFEAMNVFRLIGFILVRVAGASCPALWDPAEPRKWMYGYYDEVVCKAFPAGSDAIQGSLTGHQL